MKLSRLKGIWEKYRNKGLSIIAINTYPNEKGAAEFWEKNELTYHHLIDDGLKYKEGVLGLSGHPLSILLDNNKRVIGYKRGFTEGDEVKLEAKIATLLEQ